MRKIAVLGCGYAGLLVAIKAKRSNSSAEVLCIDRDFAGGLLRSVALNGFVFDEGGSHVVFSKRQEIVEGILSLGGEWISRERLAYVYMDGGFIPYPFENGIYVLPAELRVRYGLSILKALISSSGERPRNLREWIVNTFGEEVASDYLIPYNEKIWKRPLEQISADWAYIPGRLPLPSLGDIVKAIAGLPTVGYREQAVFYYPRKGGIVEQWRAAYRRAEELGVKFLQMEVREVKKVGSEFLINGVVKADKVISTLPLREAPAIFVLSEESFRVAERLDYNSVIVVGVGLNSPAPKQHWIYVPDRRVPFHRYAWISNYGEDLPPNKSALIAEITVPPSEKVDVDALKHETVHWLAELGVIREEDIAVVATWFHKYGYPIYTLSHSEDTQIIEGELRETGVITFGRWGNWQYWNTDKIYEKSMDLHL
jgi:protoporphyrinogen oxidase